MYTLSFACNFREFTDLLTLRPVRSLLLSGLISTDNKLKRGLRKEALGHENKEQMDVVNSTQQRKGLESKRGTLMLLRN